MQIEKIEDLEFNGLTIKWRITYDCNFQCSYCIQNKCRKDNMDFDIFSTAERIEKLIQKSKQKNVELMLIGGEVSLLPLVDIIKKIPSVTLLHITTNLSADVDFYNRLNDIVPLKLCASFHDEYFELDDFISKFEKINCENKVIETVLNSKTENLVNELVEKCKVKGIDYLIDSDRMECDKQKLISSNTKPRLKVTFENGVEKIYNNKYDMFSDSDIPFIYSKETYLLKTGGMICNRGFNYLYIRGDVLIGGNGFCHERLKLEDWIPTESECGEGNLCSFCGVLNLRR